MTMSPETEKALKEVVIYSSGLIESRWSVADGWLVQGTTGGRCSDCNDEDAALAALYNAADHMKALIEENREMKRAKANEEAGYRRWLDGQQLPHPQPSVAGARDGWSCARCGSFVPNGNVHHCPTTAIGTLR